MLSLLKNSLSGYGFEVSVCKEPKDAVRTIKSFAANLILLDLLMPNLGGFEICEILNNDPQTRSIPIIIISRFGDLIDIKKSYKLGAVGYFVKPFALGDLSKEITKAIINKENLL